LIAQGQIWTSLSSRAWSMQAVAQAPQKVHSPRLKSTSGKPPTMTMIRVGQIKPQPFLL
jgi:hypothetical protein